jgi:tetratricopeptide (TPR) repeat protein
LLKLVSSMLCLLLVFIGVGCGGKRPAARHSTTPVVASTLATPSPAKYVHPDEEILAEAVRGQHISPGEVAILSDRMLSDGSPTFKNEKTMARLDILLNKSLNYAPRDVRSRILRNLGIIHYHQCKYSLARQELQQANELFPRDARTHFYLARLAVQNGCIYQGKGLSKKAKGQFNLAANELELARKLEPSNPTYRQDLQQVIKKEKTCPPDLKK